MQGTPCALIIGAGDASFDAAFGTVARRLADAGLAASVTERADNS